MHCVHGAQKKEQLQSSHSFPGMRSRRRIALRTFQTTMNTIAKDTRSTMPHMPYQTECPARPTRASMILWGGSAKMRMVREAIASVKSTAAMAAHEFGTHGGLAVR